jgi:hypothetical protein
MGTLSWFYLESPMLRLRERLDRRDAQREAALPGRAPRSGLAPAPPPT